MGQTTLSCAGANGADKALGRLTSKTDGEARVESFTYDALDRVKKITYSDGSEIVNTRDADGNLTQRVDDTGTSTYTYDDLGRITRQTDAAARTKTYGYDPVGNPHLDHRQRVHESGGTPT